MAPKNAHQCHFDLSWCHVYLDCLRQEKLRHFNLAIFWGQKKPWHSTGGAEELLSCFWSSGAVILKSKQWDTNLLGKWSTLHPWHPMWNTKHAYLSARRFFIFDRQSASVPSSTWTKSGVHSLLVSCENLDLPPSCGGQTLKGKHWCSTTQPRNHFPLILQVLLKHSLEL